jgi:hypothetical protein
MLRLPMLSIVTISICSLTRYFDTCTIDMLVTILKSNWKKAKTIYTNTKGRN